MKQDDYVKIVGVDGNYRYGYISETHDKGFTLVISLFEEGESKIAYDTAADALIGEAPIDYVSLLTETEKRIVPLLSAQYNTNQIASEMSISPSTVRTHLGMLRVKLQLDNRSQLIAFSRGLEPLIKKQAIVDEAIADMR
jgi:DNA-binding CsgD family transcriptional regulator